MSHASEADRQKAYTSPTSAAPVLVGFDGEEGGRDALALARLLCSIRGCGCVIAIPRPDLAGGAQTALEGIENKTRVIGVLSPAEMLVKCAEEVHAGTLVVGATRLDRLGRSLVGTVAWHALREAPCEVVVAPRGYAASGPQSLRKVAVAVDGAEESKVAMTRAEDLAREAGAKLEVLVADDPLVSGFEAEFPWDAPDSLSNVLDAALGSVDPALSPTGRRIDPGWRKVASTVAASIAEACAADVDILVTGSRRPLEQFLTGSVTKRLVGEAPCPVLVVPHRKPT